MADEKGSSAAPGQLRRKRKQQQQQRRRFPRREEGGGGGGEGEGLWPPPPPAPAAPFPPAAWEGGQGPMAAPGRKRPGKRSRGGGARGRGGRPWRGRRGRGRGGPGPWGPPGMEEGPWGEGQERQPPWGPPEEGGGGQPQWGPPEMEEGPWGPPEMDGRQGPWGLPEMERREGPWGPPEMDESKGPWGAPEMNGREGPWAPPEMEGGGPWEEGGGGQPWGPPERAEGPPPPEREGRGGGWLWGSRERSWGPPERQRERESRGRPREGGPERNGSPGRALSPAREGGPWGAPDPEGPRGSWGSWGWDPHRGAPQRSRWDSPREGEAARQGPPARESQAPLRALGPAKPWRGRSESPAEGRERGHPPEKLRRVRLGGPERSRLSQEGLEGPRGQQDPNRAWREGSAEHSYPPPPRHQPLLEAIAVGGPWRGPQEVEGELPGPSREEWGWPSPRWQAAEEREQGSPKWEEGQEPFRGQSPLEQRGRAHLLSHYDDGQRATESPRRQWLPEGHLASFQGGWGPRGGRVDREIEQGWKAEDGHAGGAGDLGANAFAAGPPPVPKEWTPSEQVLSFWEQCRTVLKKKPRRYMLSTCPRPTLPDNSSQTPELNSSVSAMLKPQQQKEIACATRSLHSLQDEVLDMLGPAMTVYEMAEEALAKGEAVDPMELRGWARCLVRFIGSINENLTLQRRVVVLGAIHPRLKCVTTKMTSQNTSGLLFAEDKVKLLKEIIKRFPQLAQTSQAPKRARPFLRRRAPVRSAPRHPHSAEKPYRRSPADQHEEEHH